MQSDYKGSQDCQCFYTALKPRSKYWLLMQISIPHQPSVLGSSATAIQLLLPKYTFVVHSGASWQLRFHAPLENALCSHKDAGMGTMIGMEIMHRQFHNVPMFPLVVKDNSLTANNAYLKMTTAVRNLTSSSVLLTFHLCSAFHSNVFM